jgi:hypothetical protein
MVLAAEVHLAEGYLRRSKSTLNKVKPLKFRDSAHEGRHFPRGQQNFWTIPGIN